MNKKAFFLSLIFLFSSYNLFSQLPSSPKREFRGAWLATVVNIDWPSKPGLSSEIQKKELLRILDDHQRSGINAIMLQVRPSTDAFYGKGREMWSRFLTGKQGLPPNPYYDPLDFAIDEAHKRGMELHAWFNPYRATFDLLDSHTNPNHITKQKPEWFFTFSGKKLFNPGIPEVREYIVQVIMDVVKNYDIDGVHFDDYFYPYPEKNQVIRDTDTYQKYGSEFQDISDWRRNNVDTLIQTLSDSIHASKSYVKFGISPFGIWRNLSQDPEGSQSNGFDGYGKLYADARKWTKEGWIDYINPQIYFPFFYAAAPYEKLVDWWSNNTYGKHLYIGQAAYRAAENREGWRNRQQIPDQIRYLRNNARVQGSVFFSSKSLTDNLAGVNDSLRTEFYRYPALQPAMLWLDPIAPNVPREVQVKAFDNCVDLNWQAPLKASDGETAYGYVVYRFNEGDDINTSDPKNILQLSFDSKQTSFKDNSVLPNKRYTYIVTAIDRLKNESDHSAKVGIQTTEVSTSTTGGK
ncbi:glycoside hydrolase family 10 protein [Daejeonella oryzae]|uniref:glycoside hydrolase family 10 protein n=1 Tax=Daejeonella oryzae TaxID=1122943 RepID=UPI00041EF682|nr:family 10 glycosylhydrolase [Daejeonella oryzae]